MKAEELRSQTEAQLRKKLVDTRKDLLNFRFAKVSSEVTDTSQVRKNKRLIARIKTVLTEKAKGSA